MSQAIPSPIESPQPDPFLGTWLDDTYHSRAKKGQDFIILLDSAKNDRGDGKTTLAIALAGYMDRTEEGLTPDKCFINPDEIIKAYTQQPEGSALILDEAEYGASKYRAGSNTNKALRELVSMGRVEEKYLIFTMPNTGELDTDLKSLCHVWIMVENRGEATVHSLQYHKYRNKLLTPVKHQLYWEKLEDPRLKQVYRSLTSEKRSILAGEEGNLQMMTAKEAEKKAKDIAEKESRRTRNQFIKDLYNQTDLTQREVADVVGLTNATVNQIINGKLKVKD